MVIPLRVPYLGVDPVLGDVSMRPYLPVTLEYRGTNIAASALLDTGASLNVLPYSLGLSLGAVWREEAAILRLGGNLAPSYVSRIASLQAKIAEYLYAHPADISQIAAALPAAVLTD